MDNNRTKASIRNAFVAISMQLLTLLLMFVQRTFLIKTLNSEYLGIEGLFSNILSLLNMVELGFGSALVYSMYKPMAEQDEKKLTVLMKFYASVYNTIGIIVLILGFSLAPFLNYLIKDTPDIPELTLIYCMYVLNTGLSYFFIYKSSIITVAQDQYIINLNKFIFTVIQNIIQIVLLVLFRNYILYFSATLLCTFFTNISISIIADKRHPFIRNKTSEKMSKSEITEIKKYVAAMFTNKLGWIVLNSTDNILISKLVSVVLVGVYSNYLLIINALHGLIQRIYSSLTASVGNLGASSDKEHSYTVFKRIFFMTCIIAGFCSVFLYALLNPFIVIWIGQEYILDEFSVILIIINFYLATIRRAAYTFDEAYGLFWHCRHKPVLEAICNLGLSIVLGSAIGINGILLGTVISTLSFTFWIEPYVLYKYTFNIAVLEYLKLCFYYSLITLVCFIPCVILRNILSDYTLLNFLIKIIICLLSVIIVYFTAYRKNEDFNYFMTLAKKYIKRRKQKGHD